VPLPTPHTSIVFDPFDYIPIFGATVTVCGMKRATAGTNATAIHIPPGFPFAPKLPDTDDELFMGSSTVVADGDPFSYTAVPVLSCQVAGMMGPPRPKKPGPPSLMVLPTTVNLAIPTSVVVGGPPTISLMGMAFKGIFAALGKFAKSGLFKRMRQALFKNMDSGFLKCLILRAEPVNILTGAVAVGQEDFKLLGRIPFEWVRSYSSGSRRKGLCGYGWETPGDARLEVDVATGSVSMMYPSKGLMIFERLPVARGEVGAELELIDGAWLTDHGQEFQVRTKEDRIYHFSKSLTRQAAEGITEYPLFRISDLCGNTIDFEWRQGVLSSILDSAGRRLNILGEQGCITEVSLNIPEQDRPHVFVRYEYDGPANLVSVIDALGHPYTFAYDDHHMVRHTDRNGLSFYYEYHTATNGEQRVIHAWGDSGLYDYQFEYVDVLNERRITNSLGHVSIVKLNEVGLPMSEIDPLGGMTIFEYDGAGRTTAVQDPGGRRTEYQYDERGNLVKLTRPDGISIVSKFDGNNKAIGITDPNGALWQQEWNERGLLTKQITPLGNVSCYEYDQRDQLIAFTNPRGARAELRFDGMSNLSVLTDALGYSTQFTYDPFGNVTSKMDPLGRTTRYEYDRKGRLLQATLPSGASISCGYDAQDNLIRYVDENGAETRLDYFGLGEIAKRRQPDGGQVQYHYDTEERLIGVTNQRGEGYELRRDALGRIVAEIDYWGQGHRYEYDAGGYLKRSTDPLGRHITYATDLLGRIVKKMLPDEFTEEFAYDANGNLISAKNPHIKLERKFDPEGRLLQEAQGDGFTIENKYDEAGNRIQRTTSLGNTIGYTYDLLDQVAAIGINSEEPTKITRDAAGQITHETLSVQLSRRSHHSPDGLLTEQVVMAGAMPLFSTQYEYDRSGNLTRRTDSLYGTDIYGYDPVGRIIEHINPQGHLTRYLNDPAGDRLVTRVNERNPRIEPLTGTEIQEWQREGEYRGVYYRFDRAGNLIERRNGRRNFRLTWDTNQRLIESISSGSRTSYGYDPLGRRLFKQTQDNGKLTSFYWDGDALVGENTIQSRATEQKDLVHEYVYYPNSFEPLVMIVSDLNGPHTLHYHNQPNGCPMRLTNKNGDVNWAVEYAASGAVAQIHADYVPNPLRLQGQYYDEETGLHYNRYRYYDDHVHSFVSRDPLGLDAGPNLYRIAPNVWSWLDALGLKCYELPSFKKITIDWPHILPRHMPGGALTEGRTVFTGMTEEGVQGAIRRAWPDMKKVYVQGERLLIEGVDPKSGLRIQGWYNKTTKILETAYPV
jgi:RHS repeat-associated protein